MSVAITRDSSRVCEISKKMHKDESLKRPQLQRTTPLVTQNWTRWQVRLGASFCERVLFREGPDQGHLHVNVKTQKRQKKANHQIDHNSKHTKPLDAQIRTQWLVWLGYSFFAKRLFRDGPDQGHLHVNSHLHHSHAHLLGSYHHCHRHRGVIHRHAEVVDRNS